MSSVVDIHVELVGEKHGTDRAGIHVELIVNKVLAAYMCTEVEVVRYCV